MHLAGPKMHEILSLDLIQYGIDSFSFRLEIQTQLWFRKVDFCKVWPQWVCFNLSNDFHMTIFAKFCIKISTQSSEFHNSNNSKLPSTIVSVYFTWVKVRLQQPNSSSIIRLVSVKGKARCIHLKIWKHQQKQIHTDIHSNYVSVLRLMFAFSCMLAEIQMLNTRFLKFCIHEYILIP